MIAFRPLGAVRALLVTGLISLPLALPFGCSEQAEGERCDERSGNSDCASGLTCVEANLLVDATVGDRCCPDPAESTGICARRSGGGAGSGGSGGAGGDAGAAGQAGASGAGAGGAGAGGQAGAGGTGAGGAGAGGGGAGGAGAGGAGAAGDAGAGG